MPTYRCTVKRMQTWTQLVEAETREEAKDKADAMCEGEPPGDDYAYETTAELDRE
jgi:hypothetical protein